MSEKIQETISSTVSASSNKELVEKAAKTIFEHEGGTDSVADFEEAYNMPKMTWDSLSEGYRASFFLKNRSLHVL